MVPGPAVLAKEAPHRALLVDENRLPITSKVTEIIRPSGSALKSACFARQPRTKYRISDRTDKLKIPRRPKSKEKRSSSFQEEISMLMRTMATLLLAGLLPGCGGGDDSGDGLDFDNGGVNGTYTGTFNVTSPSAGSFTVTAQFTQPATPKGVPDAPITGTATTTSITPGFPDSCVAGVTLNVSGAENDTGGLTMALLNGPPTDGTKPKISIPDAPDVSGDKDVSFSGPFRIDNCPTPGTTTMSGTGTLTRQ